MIFNRSYSSQKETVFVYEEFLMFILIHAIRNNLSVKDYWKLKTRGK